jgi:hypothetical protein
VSKPTASEQLFEQFCDCHGLPYRRLKAGHSPTPDYELTVGATIVRVEIEQIETEVGIEPLGVSTRTVGNHVRKKISDARRQVKASCEAGFPTILLIYNLVDEPFQSFGTEPHDFLAAMYGEYTVKLENSRPTQTFHGRNSKLRPGVYSYFSAVGHLKRTSGNPEVIVYENAYAARPLHWEEVPASIQVQRVEVESAV